MKRSRVTIILLTALGVMHLLSCQKEYSFEGGNANEAPVAMAGDDLILQLPLDTASLDGRLSTDVDGRIIAWQWAGVSGPTAARIVEPDSPLTVVKLPLAGNYLLRLRVTDDQRLTDTDTILITVKEGNPANRPPVACVGPDQTITLPTNSVNLDGRCSLDPDNDVVTYLWTKIAGPSSFRIASPDQPQTQVTDLVAGSYVYQLTVRDASGLASIDTMRVGVLETPLGNDSLDIYVAGNENSGPVYWKNGQSTALKIAFGQNGSGTDIALEGNDVYVAGFEGDFLNASNNRAKYWKNGQEVFLTGPTGAGANAIVIYQGDVYVAGWEFNSGVSVAKYWRNGVAVALTDGSKDAGALDIAVVDGVVYVSGYDGNIAKVWRNGQSQGPSSAVYPSYGSGLAVEGNNVYLAGYQSGKATYWRNEQAIALSGGPKNSAARAIVVTGGDVFVAGEKGDYGQTVATVWRNGQEMLLSTPSEVMLVTSIFVFENDVFVTGFDYNTSYKSGYWRNGQFVQVGTRDAQAASIVVRRR